MRIDFADDESIRISPETIYQSLYVQTRSAEAGTDRMPTNGRRYVPRDRSRRSGRTFATDDVKLSPDPPVRLVG